MFAARSATTLLVMLAFTSPYPAQAQHLSLERIWSVGSAFGSESETWVRLEDATVVDGYVVAVDPFLPTVRVFTVRGEYVGELGRTGAGPGEYSAPVSVHADDGGFQVHDLQQSRSVWWRITADGIEHDQTTLEYEQPNARWLRPARGGGSVVWTVLVVRNNQPEDHVVMFANGSRADTLGHVDPNPIRYVLRDMESAGVRTSGRASAFTAGGAWLLGDSLLVIVDGWTNRANLYRMDAGGPSLSKTVTPPAVTAVARSRSGDQEKLKRWWLHRGGNESLDDTGVRRVFMPDSVPIWSKVVGDEEGNIWLRDGSVQRLRTEKGEHWLRWNVADGTFTWVDVPWGVEVLRFRDGYMVGRETLEFGTLGLSLFRLIES